MGFRTSHAVAVALAAVVLAAGCGSGSETAAPTTAAPATTVAATTTVATATTTAAATTVATTATTVAVAPKWQKVAGGEECLCADGSDWNLWVREANPAKVVLYFQGGGACFSGEMCNVATSTSYDKTVTDDDNPARYGGMFDFTETDNPVADWSMVYVPYCTGDVHLGDSTHDYGNGVVIEHNGMVNARFGFDEMVRRFPKAAEILVTGSSAGGVPSPLFAGMAADKYPAARITALADGSGAYPSQPAVNSFIGSLWGAFDARPMWPATANLTPEQWGIPDAFIYAGAHAPKVVMARHDHAFDGVQASFTAVAGLASDDLDKLIAANGTKVEASGVNIADYLAPGKAHTILATPEFYTQSVNDVRFIDWFTDLVGGEKVPDVRCTACT